MKTDQLMRHLLQGVVLVLLLGMVAVTSCNTLFGS